MRKILIVAMVTLLGLSFVGISAAIAGDCERSQGFWKNHPEAWSVANIEVGGVSYTVAEAIAIMNTPTKGDKWLTLFKQAVAATLNTTTGECPDPPVPPALCADLTLCWPSNTPPDGICPPLEQANLWLSAFGGPNRPVSGSSSEWQGSHGEDTYTCLDAYNNGAF